MEVTDDEGAIHLLIGIKCTQIVVDTNSPIQNTQHSPIRVFYETIGHKSPTQVHGRHKQFSLTRKCSFMYLSLFYTSIMVVIIPPQNMFKIFPQISGLKNIAFFKGCYWDLAIIIESIRFNLDRWWLSLIHNTNNVVNILQR